MSINKEHIAVDFIDPLFAAVLGLSLAQICTTLWFSNFSLIFQKPYAYAFPVATLLLIYYTVVRSWIGYHISVLAHQIRVTEKAGEWRFFLDIFLLVAYFVLLTSYGDFARVLRTLAVIFLLYILWDDAKRREWPEMEDGSVARRGVTKLYFMIFLAIAIGYHAALSSSAGALRDWTTWGVAAACTELYRRHKETLWAKPFLVRLAKLNLNA